MRALATLTLLLCASCQLITDIDESRLQPGVGSDANSTVDAGNDLRPDAGAGEADAMTTSSDGGTPAAHQDATIAMPDAMISAQCSHAADCGSTSNPCQRIACESGQCVLRNEPDGQSCSTQKCTVGQSCTAGVCGGGRERDCSRYDSACTTGVCEPSTGSCVQENLPKGTACDAKFCKVHETCDGNGKCDGGDDMQCAGAACEVLKCSESEGACVVEERGCAIDGVCVDEGKKNPANDCEICLPSVSNAAWTSRPDGEGCNDGLKCTNAEMCQAGICIGQDRCDDDQFCSAERNRCIDRSSTTP